jgi:hypothetical protein
MKRMTSKITSTFVGAWLIGAIAAAAPAVSTAEAHLGDWSTQRDVTRQYCRDNNPKGVACGYIESAALGEHSREFLWSYPWFGNTYCYQWIGIGHTYAIFNVVHRCYEIPPPS